MKFPKQIKQRSCRNEIFSNFGQLDFREDVEEANFLTVWGKKPHKEINLQQEQEIAG